MKITLNIETTDPADLERVAAALSGKSVTVTATKPAAKAAETKAAETKAPDTAAQQQQQTQQADTGAAVPSDADLVAAANAAVAKVGAGGADKVKTYIANNFTKADGSPGSLKATAEGQRAKLLADLQKIGRGEISL